MKRTVLGSGRDPLLLLLLASIGAAEIAGCGGKSEGPGRGPANVDDSAGGDAATGRGTGGDHDNSLTPPASAGMPPLDERPEPEGVVGCAMPAPYPAPYPLPDPAPDTGFFLCTDAGFVHRPVVRACPTPFDAAGPTTDCAAWNDCSDVRNGRCLPGYPNACKGPRCVSECTVDADCAANELCLCDARINHCVPAGCHTDDDCGAGLLCVGTAEFGDDETFACQSADDECTTRCPSYPSTGPAGQPEYNYGTCQLGSRDGASEHRECTYSNNTGGTCGRPFLVQGSARAAEAMKRSDWAGALAPGLRVDDLMPELRQALAVSWRDAALMEHASIAAFARFSLELLALGAPPDLVRDAGVALADEQRHAEVCFGLSSAYAGGAVGPGPLAVGGCLTEVSLESVAVTTFLEGCVGETLAAVEVRELSRRALDPVLEAALCRIAEDESRHAALAWRFVKWALDQSHGVLVERLSATLEAEKERFVPSEPLPRGVSDDLALAYGLLPPAERRRLRREALAEIVAPCLRALCPPTASGTFHAVPRTSEESGNPPPAAVA